MVGASVLGIGALTILFRLEYGRQATGATRVRRPRRPARSRSMTNTPTAIHTITNPIHRSGGIGS